MAFDNKIHKNEKTIAISLSIITIIICRGSITDTLKYLDIISNQTDWYVMDAKRKVNERIDIEDSKKKLLTSQIDLSRSNEKCSSNSAVSGIGFCSFHDYSSNNLLIFIIMMPKKSKIKI